MPISQFSEGLQKVISLLPATYGTALFRNHSMQGALSALGDAGVPSEAIEEIKDVVDCNIYCFDDKVGQGAMYVSVASTVFVLVVAYVVINVIRGGKAKKA